MRTMTKEYTVYNYQDIINDSKLKQKVLNKQYDINVDYNDWSKYTLEDWTETLENIGFINPEINFTGFYSQGDGASFTSDIDIKLAAQQSKLFTDREVNLLYTLWNYGFIEAAIKRTSHHYYHENTTTLEYYDGQLQASWTHIQKVVDRLWEYLEAKRYELSKEIYRDLRAEYEYLTSEPAILETIEANDYEFYEDGSIAC